MIIAKFGGTSVSSAERLRTISSIVKKQSKRKPVIVVSAIRGVTDLLLSSIDAPVLKRKKIFREIETIHLKLLKELYGEKIPVKYLKFVADSVQEVERKFNHKKGDEKVFTDSVIAYGEILSSYIISGFLEFNGIKSKQYISSSFIVTDTNAGNAEFIPAETKREVRRILLPALKKGIVPVVTGFIGSTKKGVVTTLGRGGSDYSAAVLGFALGAQEIQIWTDVDGIFSSDPGYIKEAQLLPRVSFREASELASFGAKVLHPRTIRPAVASGIPVRILNTLNPSAGGTIITNKPTKSHHLIAVTAKKKITLVNLYSTEMLFSKGFLARVFAIFAKHNLSVNLVSVSEVSVSVSFDNEEHLNKALDEIKTFTSVSLSKEYGMVSLIGEGIVGIKNILRNVFTMLDMYNIEVKMISLGATDINISIVVPTTRADDACEILHQTMIIQNGGAS